MRLLKLYESGLPSWAVFLPSYGFYYRPWMRRATWFMFFIVSAISMAFGFYGQWPGGGLPGGTLAVRTCTQRQAQARV